MKDDRSTGGCRSRCSDRRVSPWNWHTNCARPTFEQRRLRLLNSLLRALDRVSVSVSIDGREARTLVAHVAVYGVVHIGRGACWQ
jgi:hypothetical protein